MRRETSFALVGLLALIAISGCGSSQKPTEEVTGTVTHQGTGVPGANVTFVPVAQGGAEPGKQAFSLTDAEGRFSLTTYESGDGAVIGLHRVEVTASDPYEPLPGKFMGPNQMDVVSGSNEVDFQLQ